MAAGYGVGGDPDSGKVDKKGGQKSQASTKISDRGATCKMGELCNLIRDCVAASEGVRNEKDKDHDESKKESILCTYHIGWR